MSEHLLSLETVRLVYDKAAVGSLSRGGHLKHWKLTFPVTGVESLSSLRLQVQLSIRTFASSGLIYYVAHQNQMDYATLQLQEGRLHFMFDLGKGRTKVSHPALLSDGKWHTVSSPEALSSVPNSLPASVVVIPFS